MQGKIIKGIAGFYYVHAEGSGVDVPAAEQSADSRRIFECKAKGIFRKDKIKPLVGDNVEIDILDEKAGIGNIRSILPRQNALIRPAVANVDQALVVFAMTRPAPNLNLLDRFLVMMAYQQVHTIVCFNKSDLCGAEEEEKLRKIYGGCGCRLLFTSVLENEGMEQMRGMLRGRTTVVAGPSGVGKSSLINLMYPQAEMETGEISRKIDRGKHTTRHSELFSLGESTYLLDSPGFSSLYLQQMEKEELKTYFTEFRAYEPDCRFQGCMHLQEPDCGVKQALEAKKISPVRYENYKEIYEELKNRRRY